VLARFEVLDEQGNVLAPDDLPGRRVLAGQDAAERLLRFRIRATREERWSVVRSTAVPAETGSPRLAINVFHDVTAARRAEERVRLLAEASRALAASLDPAETFPRFAALAAASVARPGQTVVVADAELPQFLAPLPLTLLPLERGRYEELEALGVRKLGQLAGLPGGAVAERLGPDGRRAWGLARGGTAARVRGRRPPAAVAASLEFPEAIANELTLRRALAGLVDTALARPERRDRFVRKVALAARLESGGSWRRTLTLRDPTADPDRIRVALAPRLAELPSPVVELRLELVELTEPTGHQLELLAAGAEDRARLRNGLRQVRASTGSGSVCTVVEVAPWSRVPESRALLVPKDE
jgi:nucleotidyltransferase/DNA polymerase involved in DNA repair